MQVEVPGHLLNTGNSMVSKAGISPHAHWAYSRAGEPGIKYIITSMMDRHLTVEKQDLMKVNIGGVGAGASYPVRMSRPTGLQP